MLLDSVVFFLVLKTVKPLVTGEGGNPGNCSITEYEPRCQHKLELIIGGAACQFLIGFVVVSPDGSGGFEYVWYKTPYWFSKRCDRVMD